MATRESEQIDRINSEVSAQAALISQISAALDGKGVGGGSGGGSVETCTVTIAGMPETNHTYYSNGTELVYYDSTLLPGDEFTVAKNSIIYIYTTGGYTKEGIGVTNGEVLAAADMGAHITIAIYGDCTITL